MTRLPLITILSQAVLSMKVPSNNTIPQSSRPECCVNLSPYYQYPPSLGTCHLKLGRGFSCISQPAEQVDDARQAQTDQNHPASECHREFGDELTDTG